jgi:hypothetical protein
VQSRDPNNKKVKKYLRNSPIRWKYEGFAIIPNSIVFDEKFGRAALMVYWILTVHPASVEYRAPPRH